MRSTDRHQAVGRAIKLFLFFALGIIAAATLASVTSAAVLPTSLTNYQQEALISWLLSESEQLPENNIAAGLTFQALCEDGVKYLLIQQQGRMPQHLQLFELQLPGADPAMARRGLAEVLCLIDRRSVQMPIYSTAYLLAAPGAPLANTDSLLTGNIASGISMHYDEGASLQINSSSLALLQAATQAAAELGIPYALNPYISLGLIKLPQAHNTATLLLQGGGRRAFDLAERLLWRSDGQELLAEPAAGAWLSFSLWGQLVVITPEQRAYLPWLGLLGCLLSLLKLSAEPRVVSRTLALALPPLTTMAAAWLAWQGNAILAGCCWLWQALVALLLFLPLALRRLLVVIQALLLLQLLVPIGGAGYSEASLLYLWLMLQLAWGLILLKFRL